MIIVCLDMLYVKRPSYLDLVRRNIGRSSRTYLEACEPDVLIEVGYATHIHLVLATV